MFTKDQENTLKNYIEVFVGAMLIVFGVSYILWNKGNYFNNMAAVSFTIAGALIIIKSNWEYKKRKKHQKQEELDQ